MGSSLNGEKDEVTFGTELPNSASLDVVLTQFKELNDQHTKELAYLSEQLQDIRNERNQELDKEGNYI